MNYTVIGAGNGGKAMAAHLALMGFEVTLFNRTPDHVEAIKKRGGIDLESFEGGPHGFGELITVTSDVQEALTESRVIMVVVPSSAHADIAQRAAPYLRDGQIVLLHPGRTCGAIEFTKVIRDFGCKRMLRLRKLNFYLRQPHRWPAQARIFRIKDAVPGSTAGDAYESGFGCRQPGLSSIYRWVNVLHTGMIIWERSFIPRLPS